MATTRRRAGPQGPVNKTTSTPDDNEVSPSADARLISITVEGGEVMTESREVDLAVGERVRIEVTADVDDELHGGNMSDSVVVAHAGEEALPVLIPLIIVVVLMMIAARRRSKSEEEDEERPNDKP